MDLDLSTSTVAEAIGVTYRVLDYWVRCDVLRPSIVDASGTGNRRRWSRDDVSVARGLADLGRLGAEVSVLRQVAPFLRLWLDRGWTHLYVTGDGACHQWPPDGAAWYVDLSAVRAVATAA